MGETPVKDNESATVVSQIINTSVNSIGVEVVVRVAQTYLPFLAWPIISTIFRALVSKVASIIFVNLNRVGINLVITIQGEIEEQAYLQAEGELHEASLSGDMERIKNASIAFDKAADSAIHWDGIVRS